jgi:hypothetical protein
MQEWTDSCGAEVKAWVASFIWCKTLSFEQFYHNNINPTFCKKMVSMSEAITTTLASHFVEL